MLDLGRCEFILRRENVIALGNSGTGKTYVELAFGLAACQKGFPVAFTTAAALMHRLMGARDEKQLLKLQRELQAVKLLIVNELGYVHLSLTGAELMFEVLSQRYERGSRIVTSKPHLRGLGLGPGVRASHRRTARPPDPPCPYPGDEWRQL